MQKMQETKLDIAKKIGLFLEYHENFLVASHIEPDGDAIGSQLAILMQLENLSKSVSLYDTNPVPQKYRFLPRWQEIATQIPDSTANYDSAIFLDVGNPRRALKIFDYVKSHNIPILNIDHHISNSFYGNINYVDPTASSTCECLFDIFKILEFKLTKQISECITTGIITDTGRFSFKNTRLKTFQICAELAGSGVNFHFLSQQIYNSRTVQSMHLLSYVLSTLKIVDSIAFIKLTQQMLENTETNETDTEGFVNYALMIKDIRAAVFLRERKDGKVKGSIRSRHSSIDANKIASLFNGGGHKEAAGFRSSKTIEEIEIELTKVFHNT